MDNKLIFEKSVKGRRTFHMLGSEKCDMDTNQIRKVPLNLPEIAEIDLVRHYIGLSKKAHGVSNGFYPLGSCTMKYNPSLHEAIAGMSEFCEVHPLQDESDMQGVLEIMYKLEKALCEITGMEATTLQCAAGAHGELTALMMIKAYHKSSGESNRNVVIVPDSAHGTNPASASRLGYIIKIVPSDKNGMVDIAVLREMADENTAALMLTNPNTLGIFEKDILEIADIIHNAGGKLYYDGANMNAIMGIVRPGNMGFDVMHLNLHKTFSTPHGGGGPGSGPVSCSKELAKFLPKPRIVKNDDGYAFDHDMPDSIGKAIGFYGNFLVLLRAYVYILTLGSEGLKDASSNAVLNANYMKHRLKDKYYMPQNGLCMHEFVMSAQKIKQDTEITALDIAKCLLDYSIHPPTIYFPLIIKEALMVEPTETESRETLDNACDILNDIAEKAYINPADFALCPKTTPVSRLDETLAARKPIVKYEFN